MTSLNFKQDPEEPELWAAENVPFADDLPPIHIMVQTDGEEPSAECLQGVRKLLKSLDDKVLAAAELLLENYSPDRFRKQGLDDDQLLADETPEGMARSAVLRAMWLFDEDCEDFELWFTLPWDDEHTYDVEFESGEPVGCTISD